MKTHYWCLRAIYNIKTKTYCDLLHINGNINIQIQNIQILMTEIYKCLRPFIWHCYNKKSNHYKLRGKHLLKLNKWRTKKYGFNTAVFKGAIIWNNLPNQFKEAKSLPEFKSLIRESAQFSCTCCICCIFYIFPQTI